MDSVKEQFKNHQVPKDIQKRIKDDQCAYLNMESAIEALARTGKKVYRQILKNALKQDIGEIIEPIFHMPDPRILIADEKYLSEMFALVEDTITMIEEMMPCVNPDNYQELVRLLDFIVSQFTNNFQTLGRRRESLQYAKKGIGYIDGRCDDTREETMEFFKEEIKKYKDEKQLVKEK